ncbi:tetratricopeptide repeat protein [Tenacibaculum xiamenense]|uniref:tetratricopeptide repeat protein n=1 Tax=Tenacibaculum xiamenense TaxID=1261553 RepID=UPI0038932CF2
MEVELTEALLKKIDDYIQGNLTTEDRLAFEKDIEESDSLKNEVQLQKELIILIGKEEWVNFRNNDKNEELQALREQLRSKAFQDASKKIREIGINDYKGKKSDKNKKLFYKISIAATILVLIGLFFMNRNSGLDSYYNEYSNWKTELPSFVTKNDNTSIFNQAEIAFRNKNYKEALKYFNSISKEDRLYPYSIMYKGAIYEVLNENDKAIAAFDRLINLNDFEEYSRGYWYQLLVYLKLNNKDKVKELLKIILKDSKNYKYREALKLSEEI